MATNNESVAKSWARGEPASGSNFITDGKNLFSYQLLIGYTDKDDRKTVILYRGPKNSISSTTSRHVSLAEKVADMKVEPKK